jgi:hypothetical protein
MDTITICMRDTDLGASCGDDLSKLTQPEAFPLPSGYDPVVSFRGLVEFSSGPTLLMAFHCYTVRKGEHLVRDGKIDPVIIWSGFIDNSVKTCRMVLKTLTSCWDLVDRIRGNTSFAEIDRGATAPYSLPRYNDTDWSLAVDPTHNAI